MHGSLCLLVSHLPPPVRGRRYNDGHQRAFGDISGQSPFPSHDATSSHNSRQSSQSITLCCTESLSVRRAYVAMDRGLQLGGTNAACCAIARLMLMLWFAASAAGLVLASDHPVCLKQDPTPSRWQSGKACVVHRANFAASIVALYVPLLSYCRWSTKERPAASCLSCSYASSRPKQSLLS